jgi:crotonobetainyl-CoA:carnitine CoA-transferase CaiB-like acyl-CoA transferase
LKHTKEELQNAAVENDIMLSPVFTTADIFGYEQLRSREYWLQIEYPQLHTSIIHPGSMFKSSEVAVKASRCAPQIGEHNREVYIGSLGFSEDEFTLLEVTGTI